MLEKIAIAYEPLQKTKAENLANELGLAIDNFAPNRLIVGAERLELSIAPFTPISADFSIKYWQKRRDEGKKQGLVRACKPKTGLSIMDATAGWGRDAAVLASFGANVVMLERNTVMAALLEDALQRTGQEGKTLPLSLLKVNAIQFLFDLKPESYPDVIYIDPMHPERSKTALVKKDLQILQNLIGADYDAKTLLTIACKRVRQKVVVKWPQHLPSILPCQQAVPGKTVRFDIYLPTICI